MNTWLLYYALRSKLDMEIVDTRDNSGNFSPQIANFDGTFMRT